MTMEREKGFTLVELMIALVVALLLIAGVIQIFISTKQAYRLMDASSRIQESARMAMELLGRDIRMAGFQGCTATTRTLVNALNSTTSYAYAFGIPIEGYEAISDTSWSPTLPSGIDSAIGGSDVLVVRAAFDEGTPIIGQPSNTGDCTNASSHTANLKVTSSSGFGDGDIVVATNCINASIFQITNVNESSNTIVHNTGGAFTPGNATKDLGACYAGNGTLRKLSTRVFYVRNNASEVPSLYRKEGTAAALELVEAIENLQVTYGVDTDGDSYANQYLRASDVTDWSSVVSVRVEILARSLEDHVTSAPQPYTFNGSSHSVSDRRLRRAYMMVVSLRNRQP